MFLSQYGLMKAADHVLWLKMAMPSSYVMMSLPLQQSPSLTVASQPEEPVRVYCRPCSSNLGVGGPGAQEPSGLPRCLFRGRAGMRSAR